MSMVSHRPMPVTLRARHRRVDKDQASAKAADTRVVCIIPAHNEQDQIPATIASLRQQTRVPDEVVVVSDNSTDTTTEVARSLGVTVMETAGNSAKKAGAINQALSRILSEPGPDFYVLVMDADTELNRDWIRVATLQLAADEHCAVGGTYLGKPESGLVPQLQINEFIRASRLQHRKHLTSIWCLSGTGTMSRATMLREIAASRGGRLPGFRGQYYREDSWTEDFCITLAARTLGYRCVIPKGCESTTEVMPTLKAWFTQRLRWQFGTLESLKDYGFTKVTWGWKGWTRQALFHLRFLAQFVLWAVLIRSLLTSGPAFPPFIVACLVVVYAERVISVWKAGWPGRILAAVVLPEFLYGVSEGAYLVTALYKVIRRRPLTTWGHV
jgi:biofilm PGA synthesis N-glycosyltransferase PgaC